MMSSRWVAPACFLIALACFLYWRVSFVSLGSGAKTGSVGHSEHVALEQFSTPAQPNEASDSSSEDAARATAFEIPFEQEVSPRPTNRPRLISRVPAVFPWQASAANVVQGYVDLEFTVLADGTVANIELRESTNDVFNDAAMVSVKQYLYEPLFKNGVPTESRGIRTRVFFDESGQPTGDPVEVSLDRPPVSESGNLEIGGIPVAQLPQNTAPQTTQLPVVRMPPVFPESAIGAGIEEGYVVVNFSIDERGKPIDIDVVESSSDLLNEAAIESIFKSVYSPRFQNGAPVVASGMTSRVDFRVPDRGSVNPSPLGDGSVG